MLVKSTKPRWKRYRFFQETWRLEVVREVIIEKDEHIEHHRVAITLAELTRTSPHSHRWEAITWNEVSYEPFGPNISTRARAKRKVLRRLTEQGVI
jgi:hypothetical protein